MGNGPNPTLQKRRLGRALEEHRQAARKSREDIAAVIECSPSKISRIEHGVVGVRASELHEWLRVCEVAEAECAELEELARQTRRRRPKTGYGTALPEWFRRYLSLEDAATELRAYDGELVNALLQTEDYARALLGADGTRTPDELERMVLARAARQERLTGDDPPRLYSVLSEAALRIRVGGRAVLRAQLEHLLELAALRDVSVRVMPFERGAHPAHNLPFVLLRFADDADGDVVYVQHLASASYLDRSDDPVRGRYTAIFDRLSAGALSAPKSARLIDEARREL